MEYLDAEGIFNPEAKSLLIDQPNCAKGSWNSLIDDAQMALRVTLEELALLASIVTAETATHTLSHIPASPEQSAYSLLLEPTLFKLPH
jgi:hypothetical protein